MLAKDSFPKRKFRTKYCGVFIVLITHVLFGCSSNKKVTYFKDIPDSIYNSQLSVQVPNPAPIRIKSDDILQVSIQSIDPELNNMLGTENQGLSFGSSDNTPYQNVSVTGFLVDKNGFIELPMVGRIKVSGLTTDQIRDSIKSRALPFYKTPVVNVRLSNFKITVLGEVMHPGTYTIPNEDVNILDALGIAGDLTIYAKRENIMLIRKANGEKQFMRFDLNSSSLFHSPGFNLIQGDVIYVEPNKNKVAASEASRTRTYSVIAAGASLLIVLFSRINF